MGTGDIQRRAEKCTAGDALRRRVQMHRGFQDGTGKTLKKELEIHLIPAKTSSYIFQLYPFSQQLLLV